jgi:hypothetical protein
MTEVLSTNLVNVSVRRILVRDKLIEWYNIVRRRAHVNMNEGLDIFVWNLKRWSFQSESRYRYTCANNGVSKVKKKSSYI